MVLLDLLLVQAFTIQPMQVKLGHDLQLLVLVLHSVAIFGQYFYLEAMALLVRQVVQEQLQEYFIQPIQAQVGHELQLLVRVLR